MGRKSKWVAAVIGLAIIIIAALVIAGGDDLAFMNVDKDAQDDAAKEESTETNPPREDKILYYRNPMGLPDTSPVPKKDSMGMDYIPVYADEGAEAGSSAIKISLDRVQRSGVRTDTARMRKVTRPVRAPGIAKQNERTMHAVTLRADAFIEKLYVDETGAQVKKGQPLFRIYSPAMVNAQVDYGITLPTRSSRDRSLKGAEQKLRNLEVPQAVIDEMRNTGEPVMSFDWPSPTDGFVMKKNVVDGQMVRMGDEIFRIAGLDKIWVIADIAEQDIGQVRVGAPARITFEAYPNHAYEGRVTFILHELDMRTRTAKVRIEVDNPDHLIKHEMFADVEIDTGAGDAARLTVPQSALIDSGNRKVVIVSKGDGRFEPRDVKVGVRGEGLVEIKEGIKAGDEVVVRANFLIDAESNLKAALSGFTADSTAGEANPMPGHEPHEGMAAPMEPESKEGSPQDHTGHKMESE